jgi:hypothetical protein
LEHHHRHHHHIVKHYPKNIGVRFIGVSDEGTAADQAVVAAAVPEVAEDAAKSTEKPKSDAELAAEEKAKKAKEKPKEQEEDANKPGPDEMTLDQYKEL